MPTRFSPGDGGVILGPLVMGHSWRMDELTFEQFDRADLTEWLARSNAEYIEERVASRDTLDEAQAAARVSMERTFPGGLALLGNRLDGSSWQER